jgi:hypothetical protein
VRAVPDRDIVIEPARPDIVYVPSYDPALATQPQPAVVQESPGINPWLAFGGGAVVGALGAWALYSIFDDDDDDSGNYYGQVQQQRRQQKPQVQRQQRQEKQGQRQEQRQQTQGRGGGRNATPEQSRFVPRRRRKGGLPAS